MSARELFEKQYLGGNKVNARRNEVGDYVVPSINDAWCGFREGYFHGQLVMREAVATEVDGRRDAMEDIMPSDVRAIEPVE